MTKKALAGALLHAIAWLVARMRARWLPTLGAFFGFVAGRIVRYRRTHVETALARAEPRLAAGTAAGLADDLYRNLGTGLAELLWLGGHATEDVPTVSLRATLTNATHDTLLAAVTRGPVVIFASHTGNWELAAAAAARTVRERGRRIFVVAKRQSVSSVHAFCMRLRTALGVHVIAPRGAFTKASRVLAQGDVVVLPIDQRPDRTAHALTVSFLGADAPVDRAPATLAFRTKATVLVAATTRTDDGLSVRVLQTIAPPHHEDRAREWIARTTIEATRALETFVREAPADWLWLHRRWNVVSERRIARRALGFSENPG